MTQKEVLDIMKMGFNVFLTGEAGTGKTYILNSYIRFLKKKHIPHAITASTGIAATHLDGITIDSWSGLGIRDQINDQDLKELFNKHHLRKRLQTTKVLIIDEISMISGTRFDAVDKILRHIRNDNSAFGGLQVILSGDLFQLPPVTKDRNNIDYIFKSQAWRMLDLRICYLHEPRRQKKNSELFHLLTSIRHNQIDEKTKEILRHIMQNTIEDFKTPTKLYTHNVDVDEINQKELDKNTQEPHLYYMTVLGPPAITDMMKRTCLAPERLELKKGALVMFVRNNYEKGYVNGTLGKVIGFDSNNDPVVETYSKDKITVEPAAWTIMENEKTVAQLNQIPLRLAWAITVHKSQGMTLDAAEIDLSKSFVEGMGYVALSRVRTLEGLRLLGINEMALRVNKEVSSVDKLLLQLSGETVKNYHKLGFLRRFIRRWRFMYKLTS